MVACGNLGNLVLLYCALPFANEGKEFHDVMMNFEKLVGSSGRWSS